MSEKRAAQITTTDLFLVCERVTQGSQSISNIGRVRRLKKYIFVSTYILVVGYITHFMLNNVPIQSLHITHNSKMNSKMKGNLVILINATVFITRFSAV